MSTVEMQACLARLYVSEPFRKWFYLDPSAALDGYSLTSEERGALEKLDRRSLELFANSLIGKRRKRVERAFPALFALDGATMRRYYARFYQLYPMGPNQSGQQEAVDFGKFIEESVVESGDVPAYACDLARFERLHYMATIAITSNSSLADAKNADSSAAAKATIEAMPVLRPGVQIADFAYDVGEIEQALQQGQPLEEVRRADEGCSVVFRPGINSSGPQMLRINRPTRTVLRFCDGRRTVDQIVTKTEEALGATDLKTPILETVDRLLASQVLEVDHESNARSPAPPRPCRVAALDEAM